MSFADKVDLQNRLFAELSRMFAREVPMYDKSLAVNFACNRAACGLLAMVHPGFEISDDQLNRTSGERHGAIRIGRPDEYRWVTRFFAQFAMEPHKFFDMTSVGAKSQPVIATAFRSVLNPEHRVFASLLRTDYFDPPTRARIETLLARRRIFSDRAMALIEKGESQGGLERADAEDLIREGTQRIFKWTGRARDHRLYNDLCDAGFKIAADIACFESHHLNHLTPNTFCMDLYTAAMRHVMGGMDRAAFRARAEVVLGRLAAHADRDYMRLTFRHLTDAQIAGFGPGRATSAQITAISDGLAARLAQPDLDLSGLKHSGFKDSTEGPSEDTPVLLRQDAYKAIAEPVTFTEEDGTTVSATHTARFGEIEQRAYATTKKGRELYDRCLAAAEAQREKDPGLIKRDFAAYERAYASHFAPFPKTLRELAAQGLVYCRYSPTAAGRAARGAVSTTDPAQMVAQGLATCEGLRYEDFLPVSAAGIFASNLNQYGTKSTAAQRPVYTKRMLEEIMGRAIVDTDAVYAGLQARSLIETYRALGVWEMAPAATRSELEAAVAALPAGARDER